MPQSPQRRPSAEENKLVILLALQSFGKMSDLQLLQYLSCNDLMGYFDMMMALQALCTQGQCVRTDNPFGSDYALTDAGREAIALFGEKVPFSVRERIASGAPLWRERIRAERETPAVYRQNPRGEYELQLSIVEQDMPMLRLSLSLPTEEMAKRFRGRWAEKAAGIYADIFRALGEEAK